MSALLRRSLMVCLGLVVVILGLLFARHERRSGKIPSEVDAGRQPPIPPPMRPMRSPAAARAGGPDQAQRIRIASFLDSDSQFRNDVVFLVVATVRDRCARQEAGALARMANRASLPVLAATSRITEANPDLDRPIYDFVQSTADGIACGEAVRIAGAGNVWSIDPVRYAQTFPDSYFDPDRGSIPRDFDGQPLAQRAGNACNSIVYAVLPLGHVDWRCSTLRATVRKRIRDICELEQRQEGGAATGELDPDLGKRIEPDVVKAVSALPVECR